jgi:hypothetical protein
MSFTSARLLLGLWPILLGAVVGGCLISWLANTHPCHFWDGPSVPTIPGLTTALLFDQRATIPGTAVRSGDLDAARRYPAPRRAVLKGLHGTGLIFFLKHLFVRNATRKGRQGISWAPLQSPPAARW